MKKGKYCVRITKKNKAGTAGQGLLKRIYKNRAYYLLLLPFMIFLFVFRYKPMYGIVLAFKDFKIREGIMGSPWAGLKYFNQLFEAASFWEVLSNTLIISLMNLAFSWPVPIVLAIFISEIGNRRVRKVFQTASYLPHFISWVIAASLITDVLALNGPINALLGMVGRGPVYFLADSNVFRGVLILTNIWKGAGWSAIIYIAAITAIDPNLYEAARGDGAKKLQEIWHITLPGIRSTILTLFILEIGKLLSSNFDQIFNLYSPAVYDVADVLDTYTYRQGLESFNFSYATAAGFFQNGIGFVLVIISNIVVKHLSSGEESLW